MINSIGCFYSFDRTAIITTEIKEDGKIYLKGEFFTHTSVKEIGNKLKSYNKDYDIRTNKHDTLNAIFSNRLKQTDFKDDNSNEELLDIFKSMDNEDILIFGEEIDMRLPHHKQGVYLALKELNYYESKNYVMADFGTMEFDCWNY